MKTIAAVLLTLLLASAGARDFVTANDQARFLAGLPVDGGSPLAQYTESAAWKQHAAEIDTAWGKCDRVSLSKTRAWAGHFVKSSGSSAPCYYMFSGPDILYARTVYPGASTYVLCGIEPIGAVPDLTKASQERVDASLGVLRRSLSNVLRFSYFITKDMRVDLGGAELGGTVPVLYFFLARMGCDIVSVDYVNLSSSGVLGKGGVPGVKIVFREGFGTQTMYYFKADLSNGGSGASVMNFCRNLGPNGLGLLKAASYLLHESSFSKCREFLQNNCRVIVQDDSGIPLRNYNPERWQLRFFGNYQGTTGGPFEKYYQPELAAAYTNAKAAPLDFQLSYQWNTKLANLMVAVRTAANAEPASGGGGGNPFKLFRKQTAEESAPAPSAPAKSAKKHRRKTS